MTTETTIVCVAALVMATAAVAVARETRPRRNETAAAAHNSEQIDAILWALRQRESGDRADAIGKFGERSAYQFMAATWRSYTRAPFFMASTDRALADKVARAHLAAVVAKLAERGLPAEPQFIAAAWNYGPAFALSCARTEYAQAVSNLYWDRLRHGGEN
jgi:hypothetical protein